MPQLTPITIHTYQNHLLDSTRWDEVQVRDEDIIIATPYKSGTTWVQNIVLHLIFQDFETRIVNDYSPWIECRFLPFDAILKQLEGESHRRCLKTHLPLDGLPWQSNVQYIVVGRDPRDVFMSLWNHYSAHTPAFFERVNSVPDRVGPPLPPCPDNIHEFWQMWTTRGWFAWETEGYPQWSNFRHVQTWWDYRDLPNILFVHFNDLLADLAGEIKRVAEWLDIKCAAETIATITELATFKTVKEMAAQGKLGTYKNFKGGAATFYNKGTNGRWRGLLTPQELKLYEAAAERELTADCRQWLEDGRLGASNFQ